MANQILIYLNLKIMRVADLSDFSHISVGLKNHLKFDLITLRI